MARRPLALLLSASLFIFGVRVVSAQDRAQGKKLYLMYCANCHGESGTGDGPAAKSLPVKPANHADGPVMSQLSDKFLLEIISKGGSAVGKSAFMPGWGGQVKEKQLLDIISFIRSLTAVPSSKP